MNADTHHAVEVAPEYPDSTTTTGKYDVSWTLRLFAASGGEHEC